MKCPADENFPRPALEALRKAGWDVFSLAESCPGISDDEVIALSADQERVLLTFDKDFGELVSGAASRRRAAWYCSASPLNRPTMPPAWHWHWSNPNRILPGFSA